MKPCPNSPNGRSHIFPIGSKHCKFCNKPNPDTWERYKADHMDRI